MQLFIYFLILMEFVMKNIIFTLMAGVVIGLASPVFAMVPEREQQILQCKISDTKFPYFAKQEEKK